MNKNYFNDNVTMCVEVETEYGRYWTTMDGSEVDDFCIRHDGEISDIDFCTKQNDDWCRKVLNLADLNWSKNREWCRKHGLTSFHNVIDYIIENGLA